MVGSRNLNLETVLEKLETGSTTQQKQALEDYRHVLSANSRNVSLTSIKDKSVHLILDKLFRFATSERAAWLKSSKSTVKNASADRLSLCAAALRSTVDFFLRQMRTKSVRAVLGHVNNSIANQDGEFVTPLILDYFKCLHSIFNYRAHTEHLDQDSWSQAVELVSDALDLISEDDGPRNNRHETDISMTESTTSRVRGRPNRFAKERGVLFGCLLPLLKSSNRPLTKYSRKVLELTARFLESSPRVTPAHQESLKSINALLKYQFHDGSFMRKAVRLLLPVLRSLRIPSWKELSLREELLSSLIYMKQTIAAAIKTDETGSIVLHLTGLYEAMVDDYLDSREKHYLTLDDVRLMNAQHDRRLTQPMVLSHLMLREASRENEVRWSTLKVIAFLANGIAQHHEMHYSSAQEHREASPPLKRMKTTSHFEELLTNLTHATSSTKRTCVLQVLCFLVHENGLSRPQYDILYERCSHLMGSSDREEASWAMVLMARYR